MKPTSGFTLIEILITITILCGLIAATTALLPRMDRAPDVSGLPGRVGSTLEGAHSQAVEEGTSVTLQGSGDTLQLTSAGETTTERFVQATLTGGLSIAPDGATTGALTLTAPGLTCTRLTLGPGGLAEQGAC